MPLRRSERHENVVILGFDEESKAYQALSVLKRINDEGRIDLRSASVISHQDNGSLRVEDSEMARVFGSGAFTGGLVGALIGILGGPLGVLVGWGVGMSVGMSRDASAVEDDLSLVELTGKAIPVGSTGVIAEVFEPATEVLDEEMSRLNGTVTRRPAGEVQLEIDQAREAEKAARKEANRVMREQRRKEWESNVRESGAHLRERFDRLDEQGIVAAVKEYRARRSS